MFAVETFGDLAFGDIFLHLLMGNLALLADEFALEDFCRSLFDGFLLTASPRCLHPAGLGARLWHLGRAGAGVGSGLRPPAALLWPLPGRRTCSATCCGSSSTCTTGWPRPGWKPCGRRWSPRARWVPCLPGLCRPPRPHAAPAGRGCPNHALSPLQSGEAVKELYSQLGERLEQLEHRKPSPAQAAETPALELPLPAVSTPAGL